MVRLFVPALLLLASTVPASAFDTKTLGQGGSIALDDERLQAVIAQASTLKQEVDAALARIGKKPEDVICSGMRFPSAWKELGGLRVSPYVCPIGDRWLQIRTTVTLLGQRGKVFPSASKEAMRRAEDVKETDPAWTWSDTEPAE